MLNKEKHRLPGSAAWYAPHQAAYRADPPMRWLKDARNFVEKKGSPARHTRARVMVLAEGQEEVPEVDIDVSPLLGQERERAGHRAAVGGGVGCVNSIALQIARFRGPTEFAHPTRLLAALPTVLPPFANADCDAA
jgi:hypothetical protein